MWWRVDMRILNDFVTGPRSRCRQFSRVGILLLHGVSSILLIEGLCSSLSNAFQFSQLQTFSARFSRMCILKHSGRGQLVICGRPQLTEMLIRSADFLMVSFGSSQEDAFQEPSGMC